MKTLAKLKMLFLNLGVKQQIIICFVILIILSTACAGFLTMDTLGGMVVGKAATNAVDSLSLFEERIDGVLDNILSCSNMMVINLNRVYDEYGAGKKDGIGRRELYVSINRELFLSSIVFPDIKAATLVDVEGNVYSTLPGIEDMSPSAKEKEILVRLQSNKNLNWWIVNPEDYLFEVEREPVITLVKRVFFYETGKTLGYLVLDVPGDIFDNAYKNIGSFSGAKCYIFDEKFNVLSAGDKSALFKQADDWVKSFLSDSQGTTRSIYKDDKFMFTKKYYSRMNWNLMVSEPLSELDSIKWKNNVNIIGIFLAFSILAVVMAGFLSRFIVNPILSLSRHMSYAGTHGIEKYDKIHVKSEIGKLTDSFNLMVDRIKNLQEQLAYKEKQKREYELALIQSQIKPHFLYNTLNTIYMLISMNYNQDAKEMTKQMADFYRYVLSKGKEIVSIETEISIIRNYLTMQEKRYPDVFSYQIHIDPEINNCKIPKLTIQPLVENSIYHGLKNKGEKGSIIISGCREEDNIIIRVMDDGVGMDHAYSKNSYISEDEVSFGLRSIINRIQLLYGEAGKMEIESEPGKGTTVTITLPIEKPAV